MAPWTLALLLDRLSGRPSFSPLPTIGVLALPNPSPGLYFPELPSLRRRHGKRWVHRRFWRHSPRRRRPTGPAPSSRRQLLWAFYPNYFQPPRRRLRRGQGSFHVYGFNSAPTVRENHTVTGSHSGRRNIAISDQLSHFIGPSAFPSALTTSSADTTTPPLPA